MRKDSWQGVAMLALTCVALAVYYEARGEPLEGQFAVAQVVMNRVADKRYPDDACAVVKQGPTAHGSPLRHRCQFSFWCDGRGEDPRDIRAWRVAQIVAAVAYATAALDLFPATHYHSTAVKPDWTLDLTPVAHIGAHVFYAGVR